MSITISRRSLLLGGAGLAAVGALAACDSDGAPNGDGTGPTAAFDLPQHVPFDGPAPDLPSSDLGVNAGYLSYPAPETLVATVDAPPGDGQPVSILTPFWSAAPVPMGQNSFWQHLNELIGSEVDAQLIPGTDYPSKFATTVAGGTMPDLFSVRPTPELPRLLQAQAVDLTDHLAGDAIAAYPNLANNPQEAWNYTLYGGRIYTVPVYRGILPTVICFQRSDLLEEKGLNITPTSFDEFFEWASQLNDPAGNRWAFANFPYEFLRQTLGLPNTWREENGTFTSAWELEQQQEFLEAGRRIVEAGLVHPEGFTGEGWKERFYNGQAYFCRDSLAAWGQFHSQYYTAYPEADPAAFQITGVPVFDFDATTSGAPWRGPAVSVSAAIGKQSEDRVETLLGILNYLAAPLGSVEALDGRLGIEGEHYTWVDGKPVATDLGKAEAFAMTDLIDAPFVIRSNYTQAVESLHAFQTAIAPIAVANPADVLYSETQLAEGAGLQTLIDDATNEILQGRQSVDSWTQVVADFKSGGGDAIKAELEEAFAAANA